MIFELLKISLAFFLYIVLVYVLVPLRIKLAILKISIGIVAGFFGFPALLLEKTGDFLIKPLSILQQKIERKIESSRQSR